jgi:Rrf2 family protein
MIITREVDYAVRILRQLTKGEMLTALEFEAREQVSVNFVRKILIKLRNAGLVSVTRGTKGGYRIGKKPEEITLWDIKVAIDADSMVNKCLCEGYECESGDVEACLFRHKCLELEDLLSREMKTKRLVDFCFLPNN